MNENLKRHNVQIKKFIRLIQYSTTLYRPSCETLSVSTNGTMTETPSDPGVAGQTVSSSSWSELAPNLLP